MMKKQRCLSRFVCVAALALPAALPAQEGVDSAELQTVRNDIEFISNTAVPARIDSRNSIFGLGASPGSAVAGGAEETGSRGRYFVIHRIHPPEIDKLDGDIFGLGSGAGVDTIVNLRLIIQGYLQNAYGYAAADASLLAEYITIYNAVHRQDRAYFSQRYKTPFLNDLTPGIEGIALHYSEWPGKTLLVVPLMTAAGGSLSAVDTSSITEEPVINKMREDEDRGIEKRQAMVDLKEREAEAAQERSDQLGAQNKAEEKRIETEKERITKEEKRQQREEAAIETAKAEAATPEEKAAVLEREERLNEEKEQLAGDKETVRQDEKALEESKQEEEKSQALAERKTQEAEKEREAISGEQMAIINKEKSESPPPAPAEPSGIPAVYISGSGSPLGRLVKVNPQSAETVKSSALSRISARTFTAFGDKYIAVVQSGSDYKLVGIDPAALASINQSEENLNENTLLWVQGSKIYAVISSGGKNYLASFDADLKKTAQSAPAVHPWASPLFQGDRILIQDESGKIVSLKAADLTE